MSAAPIWEDDCEISVFAELLDTFASAPSDLVVLIKSFFDESYDDGLLCVAGYSFTGPNARALDADWHKMLLRYKRLPFFRMSACNAHEPPFDRLTETECIAVATEAIGLISKYAAFGYAATVDQAAFKKIVTRKGFVSTPYELCAWLCLVAAKVKTDKTFPLGKMSFFFESGFQHDGLANQMMNRIFSVPVLREMYRYKAHAFIDKVESRPTQAADLLAWQSYKNETRRAKGLLKPRGDLRALLAGTPHFAQHTNADRLQELVDMVNARAGSKLGNELAGLALHNPASPVFPKYPGGKGDAGAFEKMKKDYPEEP
jgi:hypothetical protein